MPTLLFSGLVTGHTLRVVDNGAGNSPRIVVEVEQPADAMGSHGWAPYDPIPRETLEGLLIASGVVT